MPLRYSSGSHNRSITLGSCPGKMMKGHHGRRACERRGNCPVKIGSLSAGQTALDAVDLAGNWRDGRARAALPSAPWKTAPLEATLDADMRTDALQLAAQAAASQLTMAAAGIHDRAHCKPVRRLGESRGMRCVAACVPTCRFRMPKRRCR